MQEWVRRRQRPTAIDLFAGAGGLSLGLQQAGFEVLVGADSDGWAMETHAANLPGLTWRGDLTDPSEFLQTLAVWGIDHVELVAGGVPCQPFSRAGRPRVQALVDSGDRSAHDARADLWESFIAVVARLRPDAVLVENVPDLPTWNDGAVLLGFYESLRELGYTVEAQILDGFRFGVPQHRQRLIVIGLAGGRTPSWPEASDDFVSLRDAIADLPIIPRAQRFEELPYDQSRITSRFQTEMRAGLVGDAADVVWDHICRDVRPDDLEAFDLLAEGQTYIDLPERLRRYRSDVFTDKYKRLAWGELCRSITAHIAKDGYWYIHPDQHRTLSIREAARVQTFPDSFRFAGTQTHRYRQIGNAVPVELARAVGQSVRFALGSPPASLERADAFRIALLGWHGARPVERPWRMGATPWQVLAAEIALHRSVPHAAVRIYPLLARTAPTPKSLVGDHEGSIARLRALGLNKAAEVLVEVAEELVARFDGVVPEDEMALRRLPGVGDYVCHAVRCFGFDRRAVLVDRNTSRVGSRVAGRSDPRRFQMRLDLYRLSGAAGPDRRFNHALLDLGNVLCRSTDPLCDACPVLAMCATGRSRSADTPRTQIDGVDLGERAPDGARPTHTSEEVVA